MKRMKKILLTVLLVLALGLFSNRSQGQIFWLGFQAGAGVSWFKSPGIDNNLTSKGTGVSLGFFLRYGSRPYYQVGFEWLRSANNMQYEVAPGLVFTDQVPLHNFKMPITAGYEFIHKPKFKWRVGGGMFIGTNLLFSTNVFEFAREDFRNPQVGVIGETGIQYMNFLFLIDYNYHLNKLFIGDVRELGVDFRSHMRILAFKVGMQF